MRRRSPLGRRSWWSKWRLQKRSEKASRRRPVQRRGRRCCRCSRCHPSSASAASRSRPGHASSVRSHGCRAYGSPAARGRRGRGRRVHASVASGGPSFPTTNIDLQVEVKKRRARVGQVLSVRRVVRNVAISPDLVEECKVCKRRPSKKVEVNEWQRFASAGERRAAACAIAEVVNE